jgi:hypothetical protein
VGLRRNLSGSADQVVSPLLDPLSDLTVEKIAL